jgi:RHS repeat-associated protein
LKQELSYDPWGQLRNPTTQQIYDVGNEPALFLARGYTGHEHLSQFGLINMNARLYDAALGRFLSPDVYIQAADNSQNFNRYSYCLNNPLKYTDPSGNSFKSWYLGWLYNTNSGYEFQKTFSKTALHFHSGRGSDVSMSGYEISNGDWKVFGGERTYNGEITYKSYYDKSFSGKMYYDGIEDVGFMHSYYLNNYHSGDISQSTNIMTIGGPFINIKFEDNNIASKAHPNLVAPGGDDYRSSALELNFGPFNMGYKIMDGKHANGALHNGPEGKDMYKEEENIHRVGIAYFGIGHFKIGINSEKLVRGGIQNGWHKMNNWKYWDVLDNRYPDRFYWYIGSTGGSILWY